MYQGQIIDTHMHLWNVVNGHTWLAQVAEGTLHHNFLMHHYLKVAASQFISQMVFIECGGFPENPVLETKWVQSQADRLGCPQGIIGFVELHLADVEKTLKGHSQYPNFRGIRMPLNRVGSFGADRDDFMQDTAWQKGYALLSKYKLLFEMQVFDTQLVDAFEIAKNFPDTPIVLEHLGWPVKTHPEYLSQWKERLSLLASCPHVFLKLSGLGWLFQKKEEREILTYIKEAINLFGVDRCMVGSNCPPDTLHKSFDEIFHLLKVALSSYSELDQQKIFYGNAKRLYRL